MGFKFQTMEWADEFKACLNRNPNYKKSAETWEGALVLEFKAESIRLRDDVRLWLDLHHGRCRNALFLKPGEDRDHEYMISSKESTWYLLVSGELEPSRALMTGKFKVTGNIGKLMKYPRAAGYIIKYLKRLLAGWEPDHDSYAG
ncbi:MAG: SCP2 sterol-binding domain-containing protein [Promethearchaeota archaeon]